MELSNCTISTLFILSYQQNNTNAKIILCFQGRISTKFYYDEKLKRWVEGRCGDSYHRASYAIHIQQNPPHTRMVCQICHGEATSTHWHGDHKLQSGAYFNQFSSVCQVLDHPTDQLCHWRRCLEDHRILVKTNSSVQFNMIFWSRSDLHSVGKPWFLQEIPSKLKVESCPQ